MEKRCTVLLADNSEDFGQSCARVLKEKGFFVLTCPKNGLQVKDQIRTQWPDVVVLDVVMPGLDAIGVITDILMDKAHRPPVFFVTSGFDNPVMEREVIRAGASFYILKPFDYAVLGDRIASFYGYTDAVDLQPVNNMVDVETMVTEILHQIGVPAHIKGYHYLRGAILMSVEDPGVLNAVTKQIYPGIAVNHMTTSSRVERAIRHAIEVAWDRGDVDTLNAYFGYTVHNMRGKPTNSEFIAMISDKVRLLLRKSSSAV